MIINRSIKAYFFFGIIGLCFLASPDTADLIVAAKLDDLKSCAEDFEKREEAYRANNRGVAQLEQFSPAEAVKEFRRALSICPEIDYARVNLSIALLNAQEIDEARETAEKAALAAPNILNTFYVLGLIARNQNRTEDALAYFNKVLAVDPNDVGSNVNVGQIYTQERKYADAVTLFRRAYNSEPYNSTAIYNLATALIRIEQRDEGQKLIDRFQALRQSGAATSIGQNYLEQGRYAEALVSTGAEQELIDTTSPNFIFQPADIGIDLRTRTATLLDYDNDDDLDLLQVGLDSRVRLLRNDGGKFKNVSSLSPSLSKPLALKIAGAVAGDVDNDSIQDVLLFGDGRPALLRGDGKGGFENLSSRLPLLAGPFSTGALADVDHDGDLDVFLGGNGHLARSTKANSNKLIRNNGDGSFSDISISSKVDTGRGATAVIATDFDNRRDVDLLVLNYAARPSLFQNLRDGTFRDVASEVGLDRQGKWTAAAAGDFNKDSFVDFFFGRADGPGVIATSDGKGKFSLTDAPPETSNAHHAQFADLDNDGLLDLVSTANRGAVVFRNLGNKWAPGVTVGTNLAAGQEAPLSTRPTLLSGDLDSDGDIDLLIERNGTIRFLRNLNPQVNRSFVVSLKGRVSNRTGVAAKVDMRSGSLSQKLESYASSPMPAPSDIHFGLGRREKPDAVRIIWPSGVIQAEMELPGTGGTTAAARRVKVEELDRKPSSCPYLYTWNGEKFEFVTDFLGGGEMGNWKEHGAYHFPDSDEFVRIPPGMLKPEDGEYRLRVTNELEEVLFLDHLKLVAVEHPVGTQVYPNEGLGIPTAGKSIIYTTEGERPPLSATDSTGADVLAKVAEMDRVFYDSFRSTNIRGYADTHTLTVRLDERRNHPSRTLLLLTGWTDYAFSSDNLAASQAGKSLFFPKLQVKDSKGQWQTVIDSIGISVGRPQTVVVDLTGKFLSNLREVRIVTNVKTYWDKIAVDTSEQREITKLELKPAQTDLRERGFSDERSFGGMIVPAYSRVLNDGRWKFFSGRFTRTGDVRSLLDRVDDVFVISKTGDELVIRFEALPEPSAGRERTFFLFADGYSKEMDINSGSPEAVLPLPFKGMTKYPYGPDERFPMTAEKLRIYEEYTTRSHTKPLSPIESFLLR